MASTNLIDGQPNRQPLPPVSELQSDSASHIAEDAPLVLLTGVTGFVATHCALALWLAGFRVRGTTRSTSSEKTQAVQSLADSIGVPHHGLELAECPDLTRSEGWAEAAVGCDFCLHVASPYVFQAPKDENELIRPAIDGTVNVLKACFDAQVKRIVLTSSIVAMDGGKEDVELVFNETSWGDPQRAKPYPKSKMLAEKEAWALHAEHVKGGGTTQLCTVHPGAVFGPQITTSGHASADIMKQIVNKEMPMVPDAGIGLVDARDVARIHVAAMTHPDANGKRFMACESTKSFLDMAAAVDSELGPLGFDIPTGRAPNCLLRCLACCDSGLAGIVSRLGKEYVYDRQLTDSTLGVQPYFPWDEAVASMARTLVEQGMLPDQSEGKQLATRGPQLPAVHMHGITTAQEYKDAAAAAGDAKGGDAPPADGAAAPSAKTANEGAAAAAAGESKSVAGDDSASQHSESK